MLTFLYWFGIALLCPLAFIGGLFIGLLILSFIISLMTWKYVLREDE